MFEPHGRVIPILALATAGCLWGTGFFFGKITLTEMPVATMILFRLAFACMGLLPIIFWDRPHFDRHEWGWVFVASVLGVPVLYLVQFKGLSLTTVSHASLMVGTLPMLLAIAAVLFYGDQLHFGGWLALAGSTVGAALIALSSKTGSSVVRATMRGDVLVVLSMFAAIGWILISKRLMGRLAQRSCGIGDSREFPASQAGIFVNLEPLVGAILGVSLLHENFGTMALAGGALIVGGAVYFSHKPESSSP